MRVPLLAIAALLLLTAPSCTGTSAAGLPVIKIDVAGHTVKAEVAGSPDEQSRGLMYRRDLGRNDGMLFVYAEKRRLSFWMKNTFIPLSIAFIDDDGRIVHIVDMSPQTTTSHKCPEPVRYALEMNRGWFEERGVAVGDIATFELP
jgi:uncharacterized protein